MRKSGPDALLPEMWCCSYVSLFYLNFGDPLVIYCWLVNEKLLSVSATASFGYGTGWAKTGGRCSSFQILTLRIMEISLSLVLIIMGCGECLICVIVTRVLLPLGIFLEF